MLITHTSHLCLATKQQIVHFKLRVVDLLEIFVKKQGATNTLIVELAPRLLKLAHFTSSSAGSGVEDRQLNEKIASLIKSKLCKLKDVPKMIGQEAILVEVLTQVHEYAAKWGSTKSMLELCSQVSLLVVRMLGSVKIPTTAQETKSSKKSTKKKVFRLDGEHTIFSKLKSLSQCSLHQQLHPPHYLQLPRSTWILSQYSLPRKSRSFSSPFSPTWSRVTMLLLSSFFHPWLN